MNSFLGRLLFAALCLGSCGFVSAQRIEVEVLPPLGSAFAPTLARGAFVLPPGFPEARLADARLLSEDGTSRSVDFRANAFHFGATPTVRWVQVATPIRMASPKKLFVEFRPDDPRPVADSLGTLPNLHSKNLLCRLGDGAPNLIVELARDGKSVINELRLELVDEGQEVQVFSPGPPTLEHESHVELRAAFRGTFANGLVAAVRLTITRESPIIGLTVRLENPFPSQFTNPDGTRYLRALRLQGTSAAELTQSLDGVSPTPAPPPLAIDLPEPRKIESDAYAVLTYTATRAGGKKSGRLHPGTIAFGTSEASLVISRPYAAYDVPHRYEVTKDSFTISLFPLGGNGPHWVGQYGSPNDFDKADPKSKMAYRFEGGRWKTFELGLMPLSRPAEAVDLDGLRATLETPPLLAASPDHQLAGGHCGFLAAPFSAKLGVEQARFQRMMEVCIDDNVCDSNETVGKVGLPSFLRRGGTYGGQKAFGWFDFGDIPWGNGMCSLHYDWPRSLFLSFLASGDRRYYDRGAIMARHQRDIDIMHLPHTVDYFGGGQAYEKGAWHGNYNSPVQSHLWIGGLSLFETLSHDPGAREALAETEAYLLDRNTHQWDGHYGSRMTGWPCDNLLTLAMRNPAGPCLARSGQTIRAYEIIEQKTGGHGYVIAPGTAGEQKSLPDTHQGWQEAIVLAGAVRYVMESGDQAPMPLIRRMTDHLVKNIYLPSSTSNGPYSPARVYEFYAPGHVRAPSVHLAWIVLDGLIHAAHVLNDEPAKAAARDLMFSAARFHNEASPPMAPDPSNPRSFGTIAYRMMSYPGSESKIMGNIGRFGHAYFWFESRKPK